MVLGMHGDQVDRQFTAAFIHADKLGLNFMRMFDELMGFSHGLLRGGKIAFARQL